MAGVHFTAALDAVLAQLSSSGLPDAKAFAAAVADMLPYSSLENNPASAAHLPPQLHARLCRCASSQCWKCCLPLQGPAAACVCAHPGPCGPCVR